MSLGRSSPVFVKVTVIGVRRYVLTGSCGVVLVGGVVRVPRTSRVLVRGTLDQRGLRSFDLDSPHF